MTYLAARKGFEQGFAIETGMSTVNLEMGLGQGGGFGDLDSDLDLDLDFLGQVDAPWGGMGGWSGERRGGERGGRRIGMGKGREGERHSLDMNGYEGGWLLFFGWIVGAGCVCFVVCVCGWWRVG